MAPTRPLRASLALALLLAAPACASTQAQALRECAAVGTARLPAWASAAPDRDAVDDAAAPARPYALAAPRARTLGSLDAPAVVRLVPEPERDPVDDVLRARGGRRRVSAISLRNAPASEALRMFATVGGFNLVFSDDLSSRTVTLDLHGVTVAQAFRAVLAAARLRADVVSGDILEVSTRPADSASR